jgi:hypothetical protein
MAPPTIPAPNPASAQSLDAAASNADASAGNGGVISAIAACPPGSAKKPAPPPPPGPAPASPGAKSFIEILVIDENDKPVANQRYRLKLTDGSLQEGKLDGNGRIYLNPIPAGICELVFLEMIDIGVPQDEVKRAWNWKPGKGGAPKVKKDLRSAASPADSPNSADPATDDSSDKVSTSDDSTEEED